HALWAQRPARLLKVHRGLFAVAHDHVEPPVAIDVAQKDVGRQVERGKPVGRAERAALYPRYLLQDAEPGVGLVAAATHDRVEASITGHVADGNVPSASPVGAERGVYGSSKRRRPGGVSEHTNPARRPGRVFVDDDVRQAIRGDVAEGESARPHLGVRTD